MHSLRDLRAAAAVGKVTQYFALTLRSSAVSFACFITMGNG
jgi:hypothetical protein